MAACFGGYFFHAALNMAEEIQLVLQPSPSGRAVEAAVVVVPDGVVGKAASTADKRWAAGCGRDTVTRMFKPLACLTLLLALHAASAAELLLTSPRDFQVVQRATPAKGTLRLAGQLSEDAPGDAVVETRLVGGQADVAWQRLNSKVAGRAISGQLEAPAGGWWRLEVRVSHAGRVLATGGAEHVGAGAVFVVAGQSNSANYGEEKQTPQRGRVAAFDGTNWQLANDPQPGAGGKGGSFMPPLGDALVRKFSVPIGFVACGIGATSVREWLPKGGTLPNPPTRTLPGKLYREHLEQLIRESRRAIGWDAPWFVAQASYHVPGDEGSDDLRAAQASLWRDGLALAGPDSDALKGDLRERNGQGVHFSGRGLREHAAKWAEKIIPWLDLHSTAP